MTAYNSHSDEEVGTQLVIRVMLHREERVAIDAAPVHELRVRLVHVLAVEELRAVARQIRRRVGLERDPEVALEVRHNLRVPISKREEHFLLWTASYSRNEILIFELLSPYGSILNTSLI